MLLRRFLLLTATTALAVAACAPSVPGPDSPTPAGEDFAVFDPVNAKIPQPNDLAFLALQPGPGTLPQGATRELLTAFATAGGFPNDQEVPVTIDFQQLNIDPNTGKRTAVFAPLDTTSVIVCPAANCNVAVLEAKGTSVSLASIDAPQPTDYLNAGDHGTLILHHSADPNAPVKGTRRWDTGPAGAQYIVAVRGGPNGVKVTGGGQFNPTPTFFLLTRDVDLSKPQNETLLPGTPAQKAAAGAQLEQIRQQYKNAFGAVDGVFPHKDLAVMSTFKIAPQANAHIEFDQSGGAIPLPSDFLLDATGHVSAVAAQAFGPLAPGIQSLDGFSTTAMVISQTSGPVDVASINNGTVFLYKLNLSGTPSATRVLDVVEGLTTQKQPTYVTEPPVLAGSCGPLPTPLNTATSACVLGLQPAVPVPLGAGHAIALPPLEENTEYAVLITDRVIDTVARLTGKPQTGLSRNTITKILLFANPLVDTAGHSQLPGVDDGTAGGLEQMRQVLQLPIGTLAAAFPALTRDHIAMAYTFKTQTVTGKNSFDATGKPKPGVDPGVLGLAALPYTLPAGTITSGQVLSFTPVQAFNKYGIEISGGLTAPPPIPTADIDSILEFQSPTINLLSDTTGALDPSGTPNPRDSVLNVLVSVPIAADLAHVPLCSVFGIPAPVGGLHCAPMAVFHHGLGGTRSDMLTVANELNKQGIVVVAIDSPKHGDRAYCNASNVVTTAAGTSVYPECNPGGTCTPLFPPGTQGDAVPPGTCSNGLRHVPAHCASNACLAAWATAGADNGQTLASAEYFVSGNFFRTRDSTRQDVLDQSALILAMSPVVPAALNTVQTVLAGKGIFIFPGTPTQPEAIDWVGQSYGSIAGAINMAVNPRLASALLNVGGGTTVDIFATPGSSFNGNLIALLKSLGLHFDANGNPLPDSAGKYLQLINVAKWILDPADPINFATHITANTLPNLATGAPQTAKNVLAQMAECDKTVPNPTNIELNLNMGLGPLYTGGAPVAASTLTLFIDGNPGAQGGACVGFPASVLSGGTVPHGFITSWGISFDAMNNPQYDPTIRKLTQDAQDQGAAFLISGGAVKPSNVQIEPAP